MIHLVYNLLLLLLLRHSAVVAQGAHRPVVVVDPFVNEVDPVSIRTGIDPTPTETTLLTTLLIATLQRPPLPESSDVLAIRRTSQRCL